jgi:hypothetical protein
VDNHPVARRQENRPLFEYLEAATPGDTVYIPYDTIRALRYYGPRTGLIRRRSRRSVPPRRPRGLPPRDRPFPRPAARWVIFAQTTPEMMEQPTMRNCLQTIGRRREG